MTNVINAFLPSVVPFSPVLPVVMEFSAPIVGWIYWTIRVGSQSVTIHCSGVYDPFPDQLRCIESAVIHGQPGWLDVDQEGSSVIVRLDVEPGADIGRLRVYTPGPHHTIETLWIDASVAVLQCGRAWLSAFSDMRDLHDATQWDVEDGVPGQMALPLYALNLEALRSYTLGPLSVMEPLDWAADHA